MKLSDKISKCLIGWCRGHAWDIVIPNFFHGSYEMDVFKLSKSGILIEYEIKISRSDFKNDFKKAFNEGNTKHQEILDGKRCNRFFFVVPEGLISIEEVPEYADLIYYKDPKHLYIVKNAKLIHKNKMAGEETYRYLAHKLSFREQHWKGYYNFEKHETKRLKEKLRNLGDTYE